MHGKINQIQNIIYNSIKNTNFANWLRNSITIIFTKLYLAIWTSRFVGFLLMQVRSQKGQKMTSLSSNFTFSTVDSTLFEGLFWSLFTFLVVSDCSSSELSWPEKQLTFLRKKYCHLTESSVFWKCSVGYVVANLVSHLLE